MQQRRPVVLGEGLGSERRDLGLRYEIEVVGDDELNGEERVIVERHDGVPLLIITESAAGTWTFLRKWQESGRAPAEVIQLLQAV